SRSVNKQLENLMTESDKYSSIENHRIIRKWNSAYAMVQDSMWDAPYYSPFKQVFGITLSTFAVNVLVIWGMTILLAVLLYFDGMKRVIDAPAEIIKRLRMFVKRAV
ncbi:MAG: hypothetical protein ACKO66_07455, partial [Flavobacteriales bacterium]